MTTYKFDEEAGLEIWQVGDAYPTLTQPTWPDGTAWGTKAEAVNWGKVWVAYWEDQSNPGPGIAPDKHPEPVWADIPEDGQEYVQNWKTGGWDIVVKTTEEEPIA
jgi:hypothetical protein